MVCVTQQSYRISEMCFGLSLFHLQKHATHDMCHQIYISYRLEYILYPIQSADMWQIDRTYERMHMNIGRVQLPDQADIPWLILGLLNLQR